MKTIRIFFLLTMISTVVTAQVVRKQLTADEFETQLSKTTGAQLIDVRTPEEFQKQHIKGALNLNINGDEFKKQVAALDKSKPVFVYCLSGGRSAKAANYMQENGFTEIYELSGGMMDWTDKDKPYESSRKKSPGMSVEEFQGKLKTDKLVIVDFSAPWCAPCKVVEPLLDELVTEYGDRVILLKINSDENTTVVKSLQVTGLPTILYYKNGKQVWSKLGLTDKQELEKNLKKSI